MVYLDQFIIQERQQYKSNKERLDMIEFDELNRTNSTIIEVEGKEYRTTQDPYINDDGSQYQARAVDAENNEFTIVWEVINPEAEDESEACNWDEPLAIHTA